MESPDERLARAIAERAEAAARRRRLASADELVRTREVTPHERRAVLGAEVMAAQSGLDELGDTEAAYRDALAAKEDWVAGHSPEVGADVSRIAERRGALEGELRETKEADDAGLTAYQLLVAVLERLGSAESWSAWDTFMGGGLITDMVKHSRIDDVRTQLREADSGLRAFARELADLNQQTMARLDLPKGLEFFDVVFDNIFSDWAVLRRIQDAQANVKETARQVRTVVDGLRKRRTEITGELRDLAAERERLLSPST